MKAINDELILRKPELEDVESLYWLKNDEESSSMLGGFTMGYSREDIKEWIMFHNQASNECLYIIERCDQKKVIGHVGLYNIDFRVRKAEFAILIADKDSRGKGFGNACTKYMIEYGFSELNLNRIELSLLSTNNAAFNLYLKHGFQQEGLLKQYQFKNGILHDVIVMAKFKE